MSQVQTGAASAGQLSAADLRVWQGAGESNYPDAKMQLPLLEEAVTRLAPGPYDCRGSVVSGAGAFLFLSRVRGQSAGITIVDPAYLAFAFPVSCDSDYILNGASITTAAMYLTAGSTPCYFRGRNRQTLAAIVPARRFRETVAALKGVADEDIRSVDGLLRLSEAVTRRTCDRLQRILARSSAAEGTSGRQFAESVFAAMVDAFLHTAPEPEGADRRALQLASVVRRAEDRFMAAKDTPVSLADLCRAAGVGSTTLYLAFDQLCGESPLAYLRKRQLTRARLTLMRSASTHGAVKRAALGAGLTHLGRFSSEYRELFGESPSTTLSIHQD